MVRNIRNALGAACCRGRRIYLTVKFLSAALLLLGVSAGGTLAEEIEVDDSSFKRMTDMSIAGRFYVDYLLADLSKTIAVAEEHTCAHDRQLLQSIPFEVMVKRQKG